MGDGYIDDRKALPCSLCSLPRSEQRVRSCAVAKMDSEIFALTKQIRTRLVLCIQVPDHFCLYSIAVEVVYLSILNHLPPRSRQQRAVENMAIDEFRFLTLAPSDWTYETVSGDSKRFGVIVEVCLYRCRINHDRMICSRASRIGTISIFIADGPASRSGLTCRFLLVLLRCLLPLVRPCGGIFLPEITNSPVCRSKRPAAPRAFRPRRGIVGMGRVGAEGPCPRMRGRAVAGRVARGRGQVRRMSWRIPGSRRGGDAAGEGPPVTGRGPCGDGGREPGSVAEGAASR